MSGPIETRPTLRTPLGRVLGSGSAKQGVHHWWVQRVTSIALVPLTLWFVFALAGLPSFEQTVVRGWIGSGWTPVWLTLLVLVLCHHSMSGVQVVIEDYVHGKGLKIASLLAVQFAHGVVAVACVFAIVKVALP
jgi:succinate dehydrogenase / fumarate reductase membrane anchor subunit